MTTRKKTKTTAPEPTCQLAGDECAGKLWRCEFCDEWFCMGHSHVTELGNNRECVACERDRRDAKLLDEVDPVDRLSAKADPGDRLDIGDK